MVIPDNDSIDKTYNQKGNNIVQFLQKTKMKRHINTQKPTSNVGHNSVRESTKNHSGKKPHKKTS